MKMLVDFFPILLFFIAYKFFGIYIATGVAIATAFAQVLWHYYQHREFEKMHLITLGLIGILGGATLALHNELFIKWKPTAINWVFALLFLASQYTSSKPLIQRLMEQNVDLPCMVWSKLNFSWVVFFALLGAVNLYVVYHFDTDTWVNFKLFGILGLTILFIVIQAFYLARHIPQDTSPHET